MSTGALHLTERAYANNGYVTEIWGKGFLLVQKRKESFMVILQRYLCKTSVHLLIWLFCKLGFSYDEISKRGHHGCLWHLKSEVYVLVHLLLFIWFVIMFFLLYTMQ